MQAEIKRYGEYHHFCWWSRLIELLISCQSVVALYNAAANRSETIISCFMIFLQNDYKVNVCFIECFLARKLYITRINLHIDKYFWVLQIHISYVLRLNLKLLFYVFIRLLVFFCYTLNQRKLIKDDMTTYLRYFLRFLFGKTQQY